MTKAIELLKLNLQHFARSKNALTEYHVAEIPADDTTEPEFLRLARYISEVPDESDEEVEDVAYYDGDGTPEQDVMTVKKGFAFEGLRDDADPAQNLIAEKELATGDGRKIMFKQVRTDGSILTGKATVTEIIVTGGAAEEYAPFECTITWDRTPEKIERPAG